MVQGYADHAANERTFLAWVRIGVVIIAFGFVIEQPLSPVPIEYRVDRSLKDCPDHLPATRALA